MGFFNWLLSVRKKPLEERRRFVALFSILVTAGVALLWLLFVVTAGPLKFQGSDNNQQAAPESVPAG